jgi:ankyrin repeat protein
MLSFLLKTGADPLVRAPDGTTALDLALMNRALAGTKELKELQAASR